MPPSNCFETGRRSQTQSSVRPCGAETANGCLVLDRRGITAERREGELERPEDFVSAPPERVRRAFALLTRTYHGRLVLDRRGITAERREGELERPEDFVSAPPERVRRAFALLTRTYHGSRLFGNWPYQKMGQLKAEGAEVAEKKKKRRENLCLRVCRALNLTQLGKLLQAPFLWEGV